VPRSRLGVTCSSSRQRHKFNETNVVLRFRLCDSSLCLARVNPGSVPETFSDCALCAFVPDDAWSRVSSVDSMQNLFYKSIRDPIYFTKDLFRKETKRGERSLRSVHVI